tara:strand:- start:16229 stop:17032 length:804 start_codon:yes stop_codon:yes gene_type:complete
LKTKLFLFFIIGLSIYLIDIGLNSSDNPKEIYISDQEVLSLVSAWESQVGRKPTEDEITRIINNLIEEEILYREALLLGLDQEDRIIKRRLAQKISFLKQETSTDKPSNDDLIEYYKNNKDRYYVKSAYTFTHHFFSAENSSLIRSTNGFKEILNGSISIESDPFFLGKNFINKNEDEISRNFGKLFSQNFKEDIKTNEWMGPLKSSFGHHIIKVNNTIPGYYPLITEILNQVEIDLLAEKRDSAIKDYINSVKLEYKIFVNKNLEY